MGTDRTGGLAPWRALGRSGQSRTDRETLRAQVLAETAGPGPLAAAAGDVLVAGDWHGDVGWAAAVIDAAADAGLGLVLQLGDFGVWPGRRGEDYLDGVEQACQENGTAVCFLDGNHEDFDRLERYPVAECGLRPVRPHVWHLPRGHRWDWDGTVWMALGGAVSVDRSLREPGESWWPQETVTAEQAALAAGSGPVGVMLTHDRPAMAARERGQTPGSWHAAAPRGWAKADLVAADEHAALVQRVVDAVRPARLLHGHLHERYTAVIDPAPWGGRCEVTGLDQQGRPSNAVRLRRDGSAAD